jgi:hypothetical protein
MAFVRERVKAHGPITDRAQVVDVQGHERHDGGSSRPQRLGGVREAVAIGGAAQRLECRGIAMFDDFEDPA